MYKVNHKVKPDLSLLQRFVVVSVAVTLGTLSGLCLGSVACLAIVSHTSLPRPGGSSGQPHVIAVLHTKPRNAYNPQVAAGSGWVQQPAETAYFQSLNSYYSGPALAVGTYHVE